MEHTVASKPQATAAQNPKSSSNSDTSYAVIIKYDGSYVKSHDGILRLAHIVSGTICCFCRDMLRSNVCICSFNTCINLSL